MTIPISVTRVDKRAALTSFHEKLTGNFGYAEILFTTQILEEFSPKVDRKRRITNKIKDSIFHLFNSHTVEEIQI